MRSPLMLGVTSFFLFSFGGFAQQNRSTDDLPDDFTGFQVHAIYALPSDGTDEALDTNGKIRNSINLFQQWFAGQTGGQRLRFDTYQGQIDISFVRLAQTDAAIRSAGAFVRDEVEAGIFNNGFSRPTKLYAVYYGGTSDESCGGGALPPSLPGSAAMLYLNGLPSGPVPCAANQLAGSSTTPGYLEFAMLHEIVHTLGFVATCAPHFTAAGHVSDDPRDLMYAGSQPWQPSILDFGRDDYYGHGIAGCADLKKSLFLTPSPAAAVAPPGWPYADAGSKSCDQEMVTLSPASSTAATIEFINASSSTIALYWLDRTGNRQPYGVLGPLQKLTNGTFLNHIWLAADAAGKCQAIRIASDNFARAIIRDKPKILSGGLVNSASFGGGAVAPGEIVSIFGANLGLTGLTTLALDPNGLVATSLDNTRVLFDNVPAPLVFVNNAQLNAIVPYEVEGKSSTSLQVEVAGERSDPYVASVATSSPAIFSLSASGRGPGAILNQDESVNSLQNPASANSIVAIYATGGGQTNPPGVNGLLANGVYPTPTQPVEVTVGGVSAEVVYAGAAPTLVAGVMQVNVRVPAATPSGALAVTIKIGAQQSPDAITVAVR